MSKIILPPAIIQSLKRLAGTEPETIAHFQLELSKVGLTLASSEIIEEIAKSEAVPADLAKDLIHLILALDSARLNNNLTVDQLLNDVEEELTSLVREGRFPEHSARIANDRLRKLLERKTPLQLVAKAMNVFTEHEHTFRNCRILTDIRPVFVDSDKEAEIALAAGTIVHTLKLEYREGRRTLEIFVAMDDKDILSLESALQRAKIKARDLREFLNRTDIPFIASGTEL